MRTTFEYEQHTILELKDLKRKRRRHHPRDPWRKAPGFGIVLLQVCLTIFKDRPGPRLERDIDLPLDRRSIRIAPS
jgi:hypothetical protein